MRSHSECIPPPKAWTDRNVGVDTPQQLIPDMSPNLIPEPDTQAQPEKLITCPHAKTPAECQVRCQHQLRAPFTLFKLTQHHCQRRSGQRVLLTMCAAAISVPQPPRGIDSSWRLDAVGDMVCATLMPAGHTGLHIRRDAAIGR